MPAYDDDLRLAHVLADAADAITMARFKAQDLRVDTKPDLTPVTDADRARRGVDPRHPVAGPGPATRSIGEEFGDDRPRPAPLGPRPDRRHEELRPRRAGVGDADRADGRRRRRSSALVARPRWTAAGGRHQAPARGPARACASASRLPGLRGHRPRATRRLSYSSLSGWERARPLRGVPRADPRRSGAPAPTATSGPTCCVAEGAVDIAAEPEVPL